MKLNASRHKKRCLCVVSAYAPTGCSSDVEKDTFYRELSGLIRQAKSTDIVILAGDLNAQVGRLSSLELHFGGRFGVDARRTDNGDRLLQLCADHERFLANTNFQHKRS
ncbi:craniofacial development protein 2, partial [Clonorchis sinensis]